MRQFYKVVPRSSWESFHICYEGSWDMYSKKGRGPLTHSVLPNAFDFDKVVVFQELEVYEVDEAYVTTLGIWKGSFYKTRGRKK